MKKQLWRYRLDQFLAHYQARLDGTETIYRRRDGSYCWLTSEDDQADCMATFGLTYVGVVAAFQQHDQEI